MNNAPNCSFCGRNESETNGLLTGISNGYICFDCIKQGLFANENTNASANCNFCGKQQTEVPKLMSGNNANICSICIEILRQPPSVMIRGGFIINPGSRIGNWLMTSKNRFVRKYIVGG